MNWIRLILAFFGMYTANDLVLNMEENKSMHLWNQMLIWLIFRPYFSNTIKRYGLKYFQFPLPAKNQIESVQNADHKRLQRNKSGSYKIVENFFPNISTKSSTNLFFCTIPDFFLHPSKVKLASQSATSLSPEELAVSILFHLSLEPVV